VAEQTVIRPIGVRIDSGGLGKGLAADIAAEAMRGLELFSVECSGDLRIGGSAAEMRSIEVASPVDDDGPIARILLSEGAVATSGVTRRSWQKTDGEAAHHLIDPRTGKPADTGLVQVTAIAPTALEAEVRTKAALLSGPDDAARWLVHGGMVVSEDGSIQAFGENVKTGVTA
jgi:thiamine biosynthesis lipoprotein